MALVEGTVCRVLILEPDVYGDDRGFFRSFNTRTFNGPLGLLPRSFRTITVNRQRGSAFYQIERPQGKFRVIEVRYSTWL